MMPKYYKKENPYDKEEMAEMAIIAKHYEGKSKEEIAAYFLAEELEGYKEYKNSLYFVDCEDWHILVDKIREQEKEHIKMIVEFIRQSAEKLGEEDNEEGKEE